MKGYAQAQDATPAIDNTYMGKAVNESSDDDDIYGNIGYGIIMAVYVVPFVVVGVLLGICLVVACKDTSIYEDLVKLSKDSMVQANVISALLLCSIITVYSFALDGVIH